MGKALDELRAADTRYTEWKGPDIMLRAAILELAREAYQRSFEKPDPLLRTTKGKGMADVIGWLGIALCLYVMGVIGIILWGADG